VFVAYDHNITVDSRSDNRSDVVSSAAFEVVWRQGFDRNTFGAYVLLYVDLDGDAVCTDALDVAWWFFANNPGGAGEPVVADFDPTAEGQLPGLQGITCQMFEDGL
jgi:hypothetical protein